jgi:energy-coupling factor transporter ATP-binding protein EcfA2
MQIIQNISQWAAEQPAWIDDAVRRLVMGSLTAEDIHELSDLAEAEHGLPKPSGRVAVRLDPKTLPAAVQNGLNVSLVALRSPKNLNAIDSDQALVFEAAGLTIVYGHNGAGKSGYVRALKKACRARNVEEILPDVYLTGQSPAPASALFDWNEGQSLKTKEWTVGTAAPESLSQISVFDAHCARVFVDNQAKVLFVPSGLEVIHGLSDALGPVQRTIEANRKADIFNHAQLASLTADTIVGRAYAKLGPNSDTEMFKKLATLSAEEEVERQELIELFNEKDPVKLAATARRTATRLGTLRGELATLELPLVDAAANKLAEAFETMVAAETASKLAAETLLIKGAKVTGTGSEHWEILLRSAMKYATEVAYPGREFPGPDGDAHCVLCQQLLGEDAALRLKSFVQFLEADAQTKASAARDVTRRLYKALKTLTFEAFPSDRVLLEELQESQPQIVAAVSTYTVALKTRQASIVAMAPKKKLDPLEALPPSPVAALDRLIAEHLDKAIRLEIAMAPAERQQKKQLLADLEARTKLFELLPGVLDAIEWHKRDHAFKEAIKACSTRAVTAKASELYEAHVTEELRAAFSNELRKLGLGKLEVALEMTGQKGARMQQLKLRTAAPYARSKISDILSEGEQRVIAMALFLAEVGIEPGRSGLIFDDPVSSLDHVRREKIAERLALEAKQRQIIVFMHDLAFAWALKTSAEENGVAAVDRHVFAAGLKKGICGDGLPFEGKRLGARVNALREQGKLAKKVLEEEHNHDRYNDIVRNGYRRMRDTWELLIEEHLFAGTVKRFRRAIETSKLRYVSVDDAEVSAVYNGMTRCSSFTHEGGAEAPPALPEPLEFLADIEAIAAALEMIDMNKKVTEKRRVEAGRATPA